MEKLIDNQRLRAAEMADRLGVRPQTFQRRAKRFSFPRLRDGTYPVQQTVDLWHRTSSSRGGWRRNAGAKPKGFDKVTPGVSSPDASRLLEDQEIEALVDDLLAEFDGAPWPGVFQEREPGRQHSFTAAEARSALAEVPLARPWLMFAWLIAGTWVPSDEDEIAADEAACRRELLREAFCWLVALQRRACASTGLKTASARGRHQVPRRTSLSRFGNSESDSRTDRSSLRKAEFVLPGDRP